MTLTRPSIRAVWFRGPLMSLCSGLSILSKWVQQQWSHSYIFPLLTEHWARLLWQSNIQRLICYALEPRERFIKNEQTERKYFWVYGCLLKHFLKTFFVNPFYKLFGFFSSLVCYVIHKEWSNLLFCKREDSLLLISLKLKLTAVKVDAFFQMQIFSLVLKRQ